MVSTSVIFIQTWEAKLSIFKDLVFAQLKHFLAFGSFGLLKLGEQSQRKGVKRIVEELREKFVILHPSGMFAHQKYAPTTCNVSFFLAFQGNT